MIVTTIRPVNRAAGGRGFEGAAPRGRRGGGKREGNPFAAGLASWYKRAGFFNHKQFTSKDILAGPELPEVLS